MTAHAMIALRGVLQGFVFFCVVLFASAGAQARAETPRKILDVQEVTSEGGITAWLVEDSSVPVLAIHFAFAGAGSAQDPLDKQGIVQLLSNMLDEGAGDLDWEAFQKTLADHAISLRFSADRDSFGGRLKTLTRHQDVAFDLVRMALISPRFDPEPLERMRQANIARIQSALSQPSWRAARLMNDVVFGDHPYAMNSGGTIAGLKAVTAEDLRDFAGRGFAKDRLHVAVAGDITAADLRPVLDRLFGDLPATGTLPDVPLAEVPAAGGIFLHPYDVPQSVIQSVQKGIARTDPDYPAAEILNFTLGGSGFGSRLMEEIREKRGLTYGVHSYFWHMDHADALVVGTSTRNETVGEVLDLIHAVREELRTRDISGEELAAAQAYLVGSVPLGLSSTESIAGTLLDLQRAGLPPDYLDQRTESLRRVSLEDVRRVAEKLLTPDSLTVVVVGTVPERDAVVVDVLPNVDTAKPR